MDRPAYLGIMGGPKVGKTHLAGTLFKSELMRPEEVLYYDNHGSTDAFDFPRWTQKEPWGVRAVDSDDPTQLQRYILELRNVKWNKKVYPYKAIVIDDFSEFAQAEIEERLDGAEMKDVPKSWGRHGDLMRSVGRMIFPGLTHAHLLAIFQAEQMPDPREKRPQNFSDKGLPIYTSDTRDTMLRPYLQGAFAKWFPYKLDAVFYQSMEVKAGTFKFKLQLAPTKEVDVLSRWLHRWVDNRARSKYLDNPTFDKIWQMIQEDEEKDDGSN